LPQAHNSSQVSSLAAWAQSSCPKGDASAALASASLLLAGPSATTATRQPAR
jgi:hypothetical protein